MKTKLILFLFFIFPTLSYAQIKYEKEYGLKLEDVPQKAIDYISELNLDTKIKWYKEEGIDRSTIEAKTKYNSYKYSIEFDSLGVLEDIEMEMKYKNIPDSISSLVDYYFERSFDKKKVCKTQIQYTGDKDDLMTIFTLSPNVRPIKTVTINYEVVAKVKYDGEYQKMEFLFNEQGSMINKAIIVEKNTDILEY